MDARSSFVIEKLRKPREDGLVRALALVWESSVLATHHFLAARDFHEIRATIPGLLRDVDILLAAFVDGEPRGFLGACGREIEMLFVHADHLRLGMGKALVLRALEELQEDLQEELQEDLQGEGARNACAVGGTVTVTVNEQNDAAHAFYLRMGFRDSERRATDHQGRPYPVLVMEHSMGHSMEQSRTSPCSP